MKATGITLAMLLTMTMSSCTSEIEREQQENIDNMGELAKNYEILERRASLLNLNREEQTRERRARRLPQQIEEDLLDELQELAGQVKTDLGNIRGSIALMEGMLETRASN